MGAKVNGREGKSDQRCQFMKMVGGGARLEELASLPTPIFSPRISATLFWGTEKKIHKNKIQ